MHLTFVQTLFLSCFLGQLIDDLLVFVKVLLVHFLDGTIVGLDLLNQVVRLHEIRIFLDNRSNFLHVFHDNVLLLFTLVVLVSHITHLLSRPKTVFDIIFVLGNVGGVLLELFI